MYKTDEEIIQHLWDNRYNYGNIAVNLVSVSRTGLTRNMRFYTSIDNKLYEFTSLIPKHTGFKLNKNRTLKVTGCGMDMIFHVLYILYSKLKQTKHLQGELEGIQYVLL